PHPGRRDHNFPRASDRGEALMALPPGLRGGRFDRAGGFLQVLAFRHPPLAERLQLGQWRQRGALMERFLPEWTRYPCTARRLRRQRGGNPSMSDKIAAALSIAAVLFLAGVIYVGATMPTRPQAMAYTLDIEARAAGDVVHASGETNLPDGALLHVVIDRLYRVAGQDLWSAARVGEARVPVVDKAWRAEIPIDDTQWVEELHGRLISREIDPVEAVHP